VRNMGYDSLQCPLSSRCYLGKVIVVESLKSRMMTWPKGPRGGSGYFLLY